MNGTRSPAVSELGRPYLHTAFITYSHAADGQLAGRLQAALQRFAKPWHQRRAVRIFRDTTGLGVTPDLWDSIRDALQSSQYFILMAVADDSSVWVWDARTGRVLTPPHHHPDATSAVFSTDGNHLAVVGSDRVSLWNLSCTPGRVREDQLPVYAAAVSARIADATDAIVQLTASQVFEAWVRLRASAEGVHAGRDLCA